MRLGLREVITPRDRNTPNYKEYIKKTMESKMRQKLLEYVQPDITYKVSLSSIHERVDYLGFITLDQELIIEEI